MGVLENLLDFLAIAVLTIFMHVKSIDVKCNQGFCFKNSASRKNHEFCTTNTTL